MLTIRHIEVDATNQAAKDCLAQDRYGSGDEIEKTLEHLMSLVKPKETEKAHDPYDYHGVVYQQAYAIYRLIEYLGQAYTEDAAIMPIIDVGRNAMNPDQPWGELTVQDYPEQ